MGDGCLLCKAAQIARREGYGPVKTADMVGTLVMYVVRLKGGAEDVPRCARHVELIARWGEATDDERAAQVLEAFGFGQGRDG